eukprot:scaffold18644_cov116-Skeletonema_marinoi.AAC.2
MNRYAMYNKQHKIDVETMPVDHVMVVHLIDLPSDNSGSSRPQLRIDKLEARAVTDLNDAERTSLQHDVSSKEPDEFLLPHLVSYRTPNEGYIWTSIRTNSYDFNPLIIGRVSQKALMGRIIAFAQGINEIAKGERQDLYDMIKKQMKEARKTKVAVPLRSFLQERNVAVAAGNAHAASCHQLNESDKENIDHSQNNTIPADRNDDGDCTGLNKLNTTTQKRILKDEKKATKVL